MAVSDVISRRAVALTVDRPNTETFDGGYGTQSFASVAGVTGTMQPLSPKELRQVPEGQNTLEWWHVWSLTETKVGDVVSNGTSPNVKIVRMEYWAEGAFWHGQGTKLLDNRMLPGGIAVGTLPTIYGTAVGTFT